MNAEESARLEEQYAALLAACDEMLVVGITPSLTLEVDSAPELQARLGQDVACLHLLEQAWPRHSARALVGDKTKPRPFKDRGEFFAAAATAMRRILIDNARRKRAQKRGGGRQRQTLEAVVAPEPDEDLLALDEALEKLAAQDPVNARLVELRYFASLTGDQAAEVLGISPTTADRHWAYARAWLRAEILGH
jgi:RNA polymerase sigma factor (TIGR02999 family)